MYELNFGPHHPSTHGLLQLKLQMEGEEICRCKVEIGYLHRGVERLLESKNFIQIPPYLDRLDYLAPAFAEHVYAMCIEELLQIKVPLRAFFIRIIIDELTRIYSHIMALGCATHDIGLMNLFLYSMEEREKIMQIFSAITGNRMHLSYILAGGVTRDINSQLILEYINSMTWYLDTVEKLVLNSKLFKLRTENIGVISQAFAIKYGLSGVILRSTGINYDLRTDLYKDLDFKTITLNKSDCYTRTYLRFLEIKQSMDIIKQCIKLLPNDQIGEVKRAITLPPNTHIYKGIENPRGEFGIHLFTNENGSKPQRLHIKSPSFLIIQCLEELLVGNSIPNITAILGSLDFNIGDCDR